MAEQPVHFDLKTIAILRETLDDAWELTPPAGWLPTYASL
jgi:hypothetical protein